MQFNSYIFILALFPVTVLLYYIANKINITAGKIILMATSLVFYVYGGIKMSLILAISLLINYVLVYDIKAIRKARRAILFIDIVVNIAFLLYYKYLGFFIRTYNDVSGQSLGIPNLIMPLGISFFTFQQIMYVVSVYKGDIEDINIIDYLTFVLYFPKIVSGPLADPAKMIADFNNPELKRPDLSTIMDGIIIFSFGLFKKLILADGFARAVNFGFANDQWIHGFDVMLTMLFYTFQIYFDFSGYSDMAYGASKILNIELPMNFDSPYKAIDIRDFWKRWHMSLTGFFTKYIYIPLGGSKRGVARTYINTMIVFLVSGIWHGANFTFILWGVLHGALSIYDRLTDKIHKKLPKIVGWLFTFIAVNFLWLLFRADSITQWVQYIGKMADFSVMNLNPDFVLTFVTPEVGFLAHILGVEKDFAGLIAMAVMTVFALFICLVPKNNMRTFGKKNLGKTVLAAFAFGFSFLALSSESIFVYFNF